jgi:hypothetical protein
MKQLFWKLLDERPGLLTLVVCAIIFSLIALFIRIFP